MSKHRSSATDTEGPVILGSTVHREQVVAVEATPDAVHLSLTTEAAVELARIVVQYGSAVRTQGVTPSPSSLYDPALWHDVGLAANSAVLRATTGRPAQSRYIAARPPLAMGRRRAAGAPLTVVESTR